MSDAPSEDDDGGIFCQNCSPTTRKVGYYLTFIAGFIAFFIGLIMSFTGTVWVEIVASLVILLCPLWIKSPGKCLLEFKDVLKVSSFLIFLAFLVLVILAESLDWGFISYILGVCFGLSGFWYFLTFFPNGQKACLACLKGCCGKDTQSSS